MKPVECEFEPEVLAAVLQCRWPDRVDPDLRAHGGSCAICSDVAAIAGAIDAARDESRAQAVVPDSARVWWAAQIRARREAAVAASRPITAVQAIAFACAAGLLGACYGAIADWFRTGLDWIESGVAGIDAKALLPSAPAVLVEHSALALSIAAALCLIPAVFYLAMGRDS